MRTNEPPGSFTCNAAAASRSSVPIDFTMMYATHDAFRRDLQRLARAAQKGDTAALHARWDNFRAQLLVHHSVEDANLWPVVRVAAQGRGGADRLLDDMEREHAQLEPSLRAIDDALAGSGPLDELLRELNAVLTSHLDHEERDALPLIQAVCTPTDWHDFAGCMRRRQGVRGAATYVPWILDELDQDGRRHFLSALPPPVRLVNQLVWEPRYRRRTRI